MAKLGRFAWEAAKGDQPEAPKVRKSDFKQVSLVQKSAQTEFGHPRNGTHLLC
jgi:hypothetical protein